MRLSWKAESEKISRIIRDKTVQRLGAGLPGCSGCVYMARGCRKICLLRQHPTETRARVEQRYRDPTIKCNRRLYDNRAKEVSVGPTYFLNIRNARREDSGDQKSIWCAREDILLSMFQALLHTRFFIKYHVNGSSNNNVFMPRARKHTFETTKLTFFYSLEETFVLCLENQIFSSFPFTCAKYGD